MRFLLAALSLSLLLGCGEKPEPAKIAGAEAKAPAAAPASHPADGTAPRLDPGKLKYSAICLGCHGPDGRGQGPFPKLAGRPGAELGAMLKDYRAGKTLGPQSATMFPFAKILSDAEIESIAGYLSAL